MCTNESIFEEVNLIKAEAAELALTCHWSQNEMKLKQRVTHDLWNDRFALNWIWLTLPDASLSHIEVTSTPINF